MKSVTIRFDEADLKAVTGKAKRAGMSREAFIRMCALRGRVQVTVAVADESLPEAAQLALPALLKLGQSRAEATRNIRRVLKDDPDVDLATLIGKASANGNT